MCVRLYLCVCATALALQNMRYSTKNPIQLIFKCALRTRQDIGIHYLSILHMAKKAATIKSNGRPSQEMPRVETMYWRWGRAMGGHAYYSLEATVGQWTMGWAISGSLALAYLKCVPCAIQFPRILQRHLPNSAPLAKTRPRHRHRDRDRRVQHEKKRREMAKAQRSQHPSRSQEAAMHHLHSPMGLGRARTKLSKAPPEGYRRSDEQTADSVRCARV